MNTYDSANGRIPAGRTNVTSSANPANCANAGHSPLSPHAVDKAASVQSQPHLRQPWYREPMMWLVLGLPASVVLACVVTGVVIYQSPDRLVVQPHHKVGLKVERRG